MQPNIKIYISCHKPSFVPKHPLLYPLEVGTSQRTEVIEGMLHDNGGEDNISKENAFYCELTGQYWAWKNEKADYYGFFHYRRYFSFVEKAMKPCIVLDCPDETFLSAHGYEEENLRQLILKYDVIVPAKIEMYETVYDQYKMAKNHHIEDLELAFSIAKDMYPHMEESAERYLYNTKSYFCNMYIMKKEIFHNYCEWLFSILKEWDCRRGDTREARVDGYLSERLFGAYLFWLCENREIKVLEVPRVDFELKGNKFTKKKLLNVLLPYGTKRRARVKRVLSIK